MKWSSCHDNTVSGKGTVVGKLFWLLFGLLRFGIVYYTKKLI